MSSTSNSTELSILTHAPSMVARAFGDARSTIGDHRDRLRRKFRFVDVLLRYLFAVLAAENAGLGKSNLAICEKLRRKLTTPSWGDWCVAIESLAKSIVDSGGTPVAPEHLDLIVERNEKGCLVKSEFMLRLIELINLRNRVAHDNGSVMCTEQAAEQHIRDTVSPALRHIASRLRMFAKRPLLYMEEFRELLDGSVIATFVRIVGDKLEKQELRLSAKPQIKLRYPFLAGQGGTVLYLSPFVMVEVDSETGFPDSLLMDGWTDSPPRPTYSGSEGQHRKPLALKRDGMPASVEKLLSLSAATFRQDCAVDARVARQFAFPSNIPMRAEIPGLQIDEDGILGAGASGTVFRARRITQSAVAGEWLAVKILHSTMLVDVQRKRLEEEYRVLRSIRHRCLPQVYSIGSEPLPYILMEKVDGSSLQARIDEKPVPFETVVWMAREILEVLILVHSKGVIHRDIKPSNIMIAADDSSLKLIDFGIALTDPDRRFTGSVELLGTQGYAAPEQFDGKEIDHRVDLFGLGKVLEAALARGGDTSRTVPPGMRAILFRATQPNREDRFSSAAEMRAALDEREEGKWEGVPVQQHSPLDAHHQLRELKSSLDGIWIFDAIEMLSGRREAVALAVEPSAQEKLLNAVRKQANGACTTQMIGAHGILFTILPPDHEAYRLQRLVEGSPLWKDLHNANLLDSPESEPGILTPESAGTPCLLRSMLYRVREVTKTLAAADSENALVSACVDAVATITSLFSVWSLHRAAPGAITLEMWRSRPPYLHERIKWVINQKISGDTASDLFSSLNHVATLRNGLVHGATGVHPPDVAKALMRAFELLESALTADLPRSGPGEKAPYLRFDSSLRAWALLEVIRGKDRYELFNLFWHPLQSLAPDSGQQSEKNTSGETTTIQRRVEMLLQRPYAAEVVVGGVPPSLNRARAAQSVSRADIAVYTRYGQIALIVEVRQSSPQNPLDSAQQEESLWLTAREFGSPFALLQHQNECRWFAVESKTGLREMPDDSEIVARFTLWSTTVR
jgi:tRNA A-37 threonylcarbamoyl transferase component Bud32